MIAENFLEQSKKENELWPRRNGARLAWVRTKPFLSTRRFFVCIISEKCNFVLFSWHFFDVTSSMSCLCRCFLPIVECVPARLPTKVLQGKQHVSKGKIARNGTFGSNWKQRMKYSRNGLIYLYRVFNRDLLYAGKWLQKVLILGKKYNF